MNKKVIVIGLLASSLACLGQRSDTLYRKRKIAQSDVQIMMSYYTQDNDHSAVTGGLGTEDLQVYATQISIDHRSDSLNTYHFDTGIDIISSASTDNIDFVRSSASRVDARTHVTGGYDRLFRKSGVHAGINGSMSIESDYFSIGSGLSFSKLDESRSHQISLTLQAYFDDLRWGRLHRGDEEKILIYPVELRKEEWFDHYRRSSYNLELGYFHVINKRMTLGFYPGITYQSGLLSTPFHRVFFTDNSVRVENLPDHRLKIPLGVQLNMFIGGRWIFRTNNRFYWDDFGTIANTLNIETVFKVRPFLAITGVFRVYKQTSSDYFSTYKTHDTSENFYTSDYDLSAFTSFKPGIGFRYSPYARRKRTTFNSFELHYAYYKRSDGLEAHMATFIFDYTVQRTKR